MLKCIFFLFVYNITYKYVKANIILQQKTSLNTTYTFQIVSRRYNRYIYRYIILLYYYFLRKINFLLFVKVYSLFLCNIFYLFLAIADFHTHKATHLRWQKTDRSHLLYLQFKLKFRRLKNFVDTKTSNKSEMLDLKSMLGVVGDFIQAVKIYGNLPNLHQASHYDGGIFYLYY